MSVKVLSAQFSPNTISVGDYGIISVAAEIYGTLKDNEGLILCDSTGTELHTADKQDHTIPYAGAQIDQAIGGLLSWLSTP